MIPHLLIKLKKNLKEDSNVNFVKILMLLHPEEDVMKKILI